MSRPLRLVRDDERVEAANEAPVAAATPDDDNSDGMGVPDWIALAIVVTVVGVGLVLMHVVGGRP